MYKICERCIMDTSDTEITFDISGVCNHCRRYDSEVDKRVFKGDIAVNELNKLVDEIKRSGKKKEYDCVIGVSGGVDSTYVAYLCKSLGLNPLAVHFDNGWNSELAVSNIEKTLDKLGIDLYTNVIDWEEFKELQLSFLKASTPDGEIPTDHAIDSFLFKEAEKRNIKYIISGMNFASESISVPAWAYGHSDWKYIRSVHKKFSNKKLSNYPHYSLFDLFKWFVFNRIQIVSILNYIDYDKEEAKKILQKELSWVDYGGKHYESIYTRFFQGYILPKKFNIDKRRAHFSDLINSKQISRANALIEIEKEEYNSKLFSQDYNFVLKKFELSKDEFSEIMSKPILNFKNYPNSFFIIYKLKSILYFLRKMRLFKR